jgi:hypothetical protein
LDEREFLRHLASYRPPTPPRTWTTVISISS